MTPFTDFLMDVFLILIFSFLILEPAFKAKLKAGHALSNAFGKRADEAIDEGERELAEFVNILQGRFGVTCRRPGEPHGTVHHGTLHVPCLQSPMAAITDGTPCHRSGPHA